MVSSAWGNIPLSGIGNLEDNNGKIIGYNRIEFPRSLDRNRVYEERIISFVQSMYFDRSTSEIRIQCTLAGEQITFKIAI
jgi:hypothetical protein